MKLFLDYDSKGRPICFNEHARSVRAGRSLKSAQAFCAALPPLTEDQMTLLLMIMAHPEFVKTSYTGNGVLISAWWRQPPNYHHNITNDYLELRIRGLVITGRVTKAGFKLI